jgi:exosome complex component RRP41
MPLDTSTYALAHLRLDGRRWNDLRRIHAQVSTQIAADGSSYLEMGQTKVICTVIGPSETRRGASGLAGASAGTATGNQAAISVEVGIAGFASTDRKKRARGDRLVYSVRHLNAQIKMKLLLSHLL